MLENGTRSYTYGQTQHTCLTMRRVRSDSLPMSRSTDARRETMILGESRVEELCESSREKSRSHASERNTRTRMYLRTSHDAMRVLVVLSRCVSDRRTDPRGFRVRTHRNATQRNAMRTRGSAATLRI